MGALAYKYTHHPVLAPKSTALLTRQAGSLERNAECNSTLHRLLARLCPCRQRTSSGCLPKAARAPDQDRVREGQQQGSQARRHHPIPPAFSFSAFKISFFLGLASSHPPSNNWGPVITTVYQVPGTMVPARPAF